eukprot:IDg11954t1
MTTFLAFTVKQKTTCRDGLDVQMMRSFRTDLIFIPNHFIGLPPVSIPTALPCHGAPFHRSNIGMHHQRLLRVMKNRLIALTRSFNNG